MINIKDKRFYFILISTLIFLTDQYSKYFISLNYKTLINKDLQLFTIEYVKNFGAAFNLFSGSRFFLSIVSIIVSIFLIYSIFNKKITSNVDLLSFSFILGGTIGNGLDRLIKGYVIDFINLKYINFPVFNIADISINIGFLLILYSFIKCKS